MSNKIYKYELHVMDEQKIIIHGLVKILCVQTQRDKPCLWAITSDKDLSVSHVDLVTIGTGHQIPDDAIMRYIGTYQLAGGSFVGHVFEKLGR